MKDKRSYPELPHSSKLPVLDLDVEMARKNMLVAELTILSGLVRGDQVQREKILGRVKIEYFDANLFPGFLFGAIARQLSGDLSSDIPVEFLAAQIPHFHSSVWGNSKVNSRTIRGDLFTCAQVVNLRASVDHIDKAIALRNLWARDNGLIAA